MAQEGQCLRLGRRSLECVCVAVGLTHAQISIKASEVLGLLQKRVVWPEAGLRWLEARAGRREATKSGVFVTLAHDPAMPAGSGLPFERVLLRRMRGALDIPDDAPGADINDEAGELLVPEVYLSLPCRLPLCDVSLASLTVETLEPGRTGLLDDSGTLPTTAVKEATTVKLGQPHADVVEATMASLGHPLTPTTDRTLRETRLLPHTEAGRSLTAALKRLQVAAPETQRAVDLLREHGLALLANSLPDETLVGLRSLARRWIDRTDVALASRGLDGGTHVFALREVASRGIHRYDLLLPPNEPQLQALLASGAAPWYSVVEAVLGPRSEWDVEVSVVYSRPGAPEQGWHADGPHVGPTADWDLRGAADAYALCAFVPLIDLDEETGYTQFWPGTHLHDKLIGFGQACPVIESDINGIARAGSALLYDYRLIHRGMGNRSKATERPVLQFFYHKKTYTEQRNYGKESLFAASA